MSDTTNTTEAPLPIPRTGGCFIRMPDGRLVPENEAPAIEQQPAEAPAAGGSLATPE